MACFADINVLHSVATYARCSGIFDIRLTANLPRNLPVKKLLNRLRIGRIIVITRWPRFYRAMLCIRGTSHGPVSVSVSVSVSSVTSRSSTKTAKRRITQTTPHDTPGILVFWCQRSPRNSTGVTPYEGAECRWGGQNRRLLTNNRLYLENGTR